MCIELVAIVAEMNDVVVVVFFFLRPENNNNKKFVYIYFFFSFYVRKEMMENRETIFSRLLPFTIERDRRWKRFLYFVATMLLAR